MPYTSKDQQSRIAFFYNSLYLGLWQQQNSEVANFRIKTFDFTRFIRLNWSAKLELRGPWLPGSILLLITFVRKDAKTEKRIHFCHIFIICDISIGGWADP